MSLFGWESPYCLAFVIPPLSSDTSPSPYSSRSPHLTTPHPGNTPPVPSNPPPPPATRSLRPSAPASPAARSSGPTRTAGSPPAASSLRPPSETVRASTYGRRPRFHPHESRSAGESAAAATAQSPQNRASGYTGPPYVSATASETQPTNGAPPSPSPPVSTTAAPSETVASSRHTPRRSAAPRTPRSGSGNARHTPPPPPPR